MRVFISWAHRGEGWTDSQAITWAGMVEGLARLLANTPGVDVTLDLWHRHDIDVDWTRWGQQQVETHDCVLVAVNEPWAQRWSGRNDPSVGAGSVVEADMLKGMFNRNQAAFQKKVRLVVLPGVQGRDIPWDLDRIKRVSVTQLTSDGIAELVRELRHESAMPVGAGHIGRLVEETLRADDLLLFRFRNLPQPAIKKHRAVLKTGYVWWGWWKKYEENPQVDLWRDFEAALVDGPRRIGLFDSGTPAGDIRRALATRVMIPRLNSFEDPQPFYPEPSEWSHIPKYYRPPRPKDQRVSFAWLCLTDIETKPIGFYNRYEIVSVDAAFNGRIIHEPRELKIQDQSMWHVRQVNR